MLASALQALSTAHSSRSRKRAARRVAPQLTTAPEPIASLARGIVERKAATADEARALHQHIAQHIRQDEDEAMAIVLAVTA